MIKRVVKTCRIATLLIIAITAMATTCRSQVTYTEYAGPTTPTFEGGYTVVDITSGPDGNLWFTSTYTNRVICKVSLLDHSITEYPISSNNDPTTITRGPDGNLWFTEAPANNIARITPAGDITEFSLPTPGAYPVGITTGPD